MWVQHIQYPSKHYYKTQFDLVKIDQVLGVGSPYICNRLKVTLSTTTCCESILLVPKSSQCLVTGKVRRIHAQVQLVYSFYLFSDVIYCATYQVPSRLLTQRCKTLSALMATS